MRRRIIRGIFNHLVRKFASPKPTSENVPSAARTIYRDMTRASSQNGRIIDSINPGSGMAVVKGGGTSELAKKPGFRKKPILHMSEFIDSKMGHWTG